MFIGSTRTQASELNKTNPNSRERQVQLQNKYRKQLIKQGFPNTTIDRLATEEIQFIIDNNSTFGDETVNHTLYIYTPNESRDCQITTVGLNEQEFEFYKYNKKEAVRRKVESLKNEKPYLKKYLVNTYASVTTNMDYSVLTLTVNNYDTYTTGMYKRCIGEEFDWSEDPFWCFTDALGFSITGYWWAVYPGANGYYYDGRTNDPIAVTAKVNGMCAKYDVTASYDGHTNYGRIYMYLGNNRANVPKGIDYSVIADYGHVVYAYTGMSVSIDSSGINIQENFGTTVKDANQVISVYRTPS